VEERLQMITQVVLSRTKLLEVIDEFDLYHEMKRWHTSEEIVQEMRQDVQMKPIQAQVVNPQSGRPGSATIAFTLSYEGKTPKKVVQVANKLVSLYLRENIETREEKARTTVEFLEEQLEALRVEITDIEARIADFEDEHVSELPELMNLNLQSMQRLEGEIERTKEQIVSLESLEMYLKGQLATVDPMELSGSEFRSPEEELQAMRLDLARISAIRTEEHPDVVSLKKRIEKMKNEVVPQMNLPGSFHNLEEKQEALGTALERFSEEHPDVVRLRREVSALVEEKARSEMGSQKVTELAIDQKPTNPIYINLQSQIANVGMKIDRAKRELETLKQRHDRYVRRVENTPEVKQEFRALKRGYANAQAKYQETMARMLAAREAKGLEESNMAEKFRLIDPPVIPEKPASPNRILIILIGFIFGIGSGVGFCVLGEFMDQSVHQPDELTRAFGIPVLVVTPHWDSCLDRTKRRLKRWALAGCTLGVVVGGFMAVHYLFRPLDVLWVQITRKLGIGL
jgi:uncharacterized protein involved in exopolysaccharide biosynthesis